MDFGVVLRSKLEPKSTKNRSKTVSRLRCKFECIFEGSWTPVGPTLEAKMGPSWGHVGPMLALGPLKKSIQKTSQKTYTKKTPGTPGDLGGGSLRTKEKRGKRVSRRKENAKDIPLRTRRGGGYIYIYIYMYFCTLAWYGKLKF